MDIFMIEPGMIIEELQQAIATGRCQRCGTILTYTDNEDEWSLICPGCKAQYGGSWGW